MNKLARQIAEILYKKDPVDIGTVENNLVDEYYDEADAIAYNFELGNIKSKDDLRECFKDVFIEFFSFEVEISDEIINAVYELLNK